MNYEVGERVWVKMENFPWWPAKVVMYEQYPGLEQPPEGNTYVRFYGSDEFWVVNLADSSVVVAFEVSSEKAVVETGSELDKAIQEAQHDDTALPIRLNALAGAVAAEGTAAPRKSKKKHHAEAADDSTPTGRAAATIKRHRDSAQKSGKAAAAEEGDGDVEEDEAKGRKPYAPERQLEDAQLVELSSAITAKASSGDIVATKKLLLLLVHVGIGYEQLRVTKIGVAVGEILGVETLRPLWPLARALTVKWAGCLPDDIKGAIKKMQVEHSSHHF